MSHERAVHPLSVGVTIDLEYGPTAGGHVKVWQRFAEAAAEYPRDVDLTLYFVAAGPREDRLEQASNVRYRLLPARRGTRTMRVDQGGGHTDLAGHHPALAAYLKTHDVLHATHCFALSRTARHVASRRRLPFSVSLHTDVPFLTRAYAREVLERRLGGALADKMAFLADAATWWMSGRVDGFLRASDHVMVSRSIDAARAHAVSPKTPVTRLRRGTDLETFRPEFRDRSWLAEAYGISDDRVVLVFAGRIDETKGALIAAKAVDALRRRGAPVHFIAVGEGAQIEAIASLLGDDVTLPGILDRIRLARVFASADLLVFPSRSEMFGNVVWEAKACGLPPVIADHPGVARRVQAPGVDGLLVDNDDPAIWADALAPLVGDLDLRAAMGRAARADVEARGASWAEVFEKDLLSIWRGLAEARPAHAA